jgi:hypothetical protein
MIGGGRSQVVNPWAGSDDRYVSPGRCPRSRGLPILSGPLSSGLTRVEDVRKGRTRDSWRLELGAAGVKRLDAAASVPDVVPGPADAELLATDAEPRPTGTGP